jgi:hypothetical protein
VLERVRSVLEVVVSEAGTSGGSKTLKPLLPRWFLDASGPERSRKEAEEYLSQLNRLPAEERARVEREARWSLSDWLYWFGPEERYWYWWDAAVEDDSTIRIAVEISDWPFPWGSLEWVFRAAGAVELNPEA